MTTEFGVRARSDNPRSCGPAPVSLRAQRAPMSTSATAPGGAGTSISCLRGGRPPGHRCFLEVGAVVVASVGPLACQAVRVTVSYTTRLDSNAPVHR